MPSSIKLNIKQPLNLVLNFFNYYQKKNLIKFYKIIITSLNTVKKQFKKFIMSFEQ